MWKRDSTAWGMTAAALWALLALGGCGITDSGSSSPQDSEAMGQPPSSAAGNPLTLAQSDIAALSDLDPQGPTEVDAKYAGVFSAIFGGVQSAQVLQYFHDRIHYLVDPARVVFSPSQFANEKWLTSPAPASPLTDLFQGQGSARYVLGALNMGTLYWLEGLVNQVPVTMTQPNGEVLSVSSSRAGIVILGEGYTPSEADEDGHPIPLPPQYRQSILLHEARHSDCTGGIGEEQLRTLRGLKDSVEFEKTYASMPCGHLHRVCKTGDLAGLAACDSEAWGAYTVGAIYALASYGSAKTTMDRAILKAEFTDQISRLQVNTDDLLAGKLGRPDMGSSGYQAGTPAPSRTPQP